VSRLSVIALSQAFQGFWSDLALDLGTAIDLVGPAEAVTSSPEMAAVIVAAGGASARRSSGSRVTRFPRVCRRWSWARIPGGAPPCSS